MELISTTEDLSALCARARTADFVAVDTEFMREKTYYSKLCLIQIGFNDEAHGIDPLAQGLDLEPFLELLRDPGIPKVFHAARQDVEIFYFIDGTIPTPLFDTQIAAMVCGYGDSIGYERLAKDIADARIDKSRQMTDWSRRPLKQNQIDYALSDVTHLQVIYRELSARLEENGRAGWLDEEMAILTSPDTYAMPPEEAWRRMKPRSRNTKYLGCLIELAKWREQRAQTKDMPRNFVLRDDAIQELAAERPNNADTLGRLRTISDGFARSKIAAGMLEAIEKGQQLTKADLPDFPEQVPLPKGLTPLIDLLKVLLKMKSEEFDVSSKLIATVADLEQIALDSEADVKALKGWRREIFGADAVALKQGKISLTMMDGALTVRPVP